MVNEWRWCVLYVLVYKSTEIMPTGVQAGNKVLWLLFQTNAAPKLPPCTLHQLLHLRTQTSNSCCICAAVSALSRSQSSDGSNCI